MSDVVGSTALWEKHGEDMRTALELHDRLVHGAIESAGGRVFKHTGDGMIAVFSNADHAMSGAVGAVVALANGSWGATGALEVRVSVHAGSVAERDGDFFGPPVNKVARINGVGNPGQVLASDVARQLMVAPAGTDLGVHQLRDLSEPVRLWQLDDGSHPSLRTLKKARHNLPAMPTEFIGRQTEIEQLSALLDHNRLVTISGVGGCGKTRLAIEVAAAVAGRFPGGVWFVDLTTERHGDKVGDRAIAALGLIQQLGADGCRAVDVLNEATAGMATLLVIDNCEHLIDDVADFAVDVLASAGSVTVLATSREALSVDGERAWRIPNLHDAAVELFVDRAAGAGVVGLEKRLDRIREICVQLDDIPLAIELAAGRLSSLSIDLLAERLDERFSLLGGGRSRRRQRQQTLQTMMDWSYGLLSTDEQEVLNQLAVFSGSFPLSGVEAVADRSATASLDVLDSLVEQSLVVPSSTTGRYRLLETVRLYALDRLLSSNQVAAIRDRHLAWMIALSGSERLASTGAGETWELEEQKLAEVDNAVAAMEWAEQSGQRDALLSLYVGGNTYWPAAAGQAVGWLDRVPEPHAGEPYLRSQWLTTSAQIQFFAGDAEKAHEQFAAAAALVDQLFDAGQLATLSGLSLMMRGIVLAASDVPAALADRDRLNELQVDGSARYAEWMSLYVQASVQVLEGGDAAVESTAHLEAVGRTISRMIHDHSVVMMAMVMAQTERFDEALATSLHSLESRSIGQPARVNALVPAVKSLAALGRYEAAVDLIEKDFGPMIDSQRERVASTQLISLALVLHRLGRHERLDELIATAYSFSGNFLDAAPEILPFVADIVGKEKALSFPRTSDPAPVMADRIAVLIEELSAELRNHIAQGSEQQSEGTGQGESGGAARA